MREFFTFSRRVSDISYQQSAVSSRWFVVKGLVVVLRTFHVSRLLPLLLSSRQARLYLYIVRERVLRLVADTPQYAKSALRYTDPRVLLRT
jgi:hypothetical protein